MAQYGVKISGLGHVAGERDRDNRSRVLGLCVFEGGHGGFSIWNPELASSFIGQGQKASNPARNGVLSHGRVAERTQLLKTGLLVLHAQSTCNHEMIWYFVTKDL